MAYKIDEIEGIGPSFREKLVAAGIKNTSDLLSRCGAKKGRAEVAAATGITGKLILNWTNKADLMRVSGIGPQFSELLEASGVDTVKELRTRNVANLAAKMAEVNGVKKLSRTTPAAGVVEGWVTAAKGMEPGVSH